MVSATLSLSKTKTNGVKEKILVALNTIIEKLQDKFKNLKDKERVIAFLAAGMNEAALEVRNAAKSGFLILKNSMSNSEFERLVMRSTSDKDYSKVIDFLEKESTSTDKFMITNGISTKGTFYYNKTRMSKMSKQSNIGDYGDLESTVTHSKAPFSKPEKSKSSISKKATTTTSSGYGNNTNFELISNDIMDKFNDIIKKFEENDFKKRIAGLKSLSNFIQEEEKLINKSKKFFQIIDVLVQCLKDNNTKVVVATQDIFSNIMPNIKRLIEKGAAQVVEALSSNVVSSNSMIKNCGEALMKKLVLNEELECSVFIQPMCHQILQGNTRAKATILNVICEVVEIVYEVKPITVTKHIFSLCSKLLDDSATKGEIKKSLYSLISKCYELAGESFVNSFPSRNTDKVWTILKNDTSSVFS